MDLIKIGKVSCEVCGLKFNNKIIWNIHNNLVHSQNENDILVKREENATNPLDDSKLKEMFLIS